MTEITHNISDSHLLSALVASPSHIIFSQHWSPLKYVRCARLFRVQKQIDLKSRSILKSSTMYLSPDGLRGKSSSFCSTCHLTSPTRRSASCESPVTKWNSKMWPDCLRSVPVRPSGPPDLLDAHFLHDLLLQCFQRWYIGVFKSVFWTCIFRTVCEGRNQN